MRGVVRPLKLSGDVPMKPDQKKRSRRRCDLQRMKARARRLRPHDPAAKTAEYLAVCSCAMCGNPRRYGWGERLTIQERRAEGSADPDDA